MDNRVSYVTVSAAANITCTNENAFWNGFHLRNGAATVTVALGDLTIPVYSNETLEMDFTKFSEVAIENVSTVSVRLALKH